MIDLRKAWYWCFALSCVGMDAMRLHSPGLIMLVAYAGVKTLILERDERKKTNEL